MACGEEATLHTLPFGGLVGVRLTEPEEGAVRKPRLLVEAVTT